MADHSERAHARLSASGAERWMKCPPSARIEESLPEKESPYAAAGTFMHELAELELHRYLGMHDSQYKPRHAALIDNPFYSSDTAEVAKTYTEYAIERINDAQHRSSDALIRVEMRVDFSQWVPGGFGTADLITVADGRLEIIDFKGGKFVEVTAEDNPQLRLYALGALAELDYLYDLSEVHMTICQPRTDSISTAVMSRDDLLAWGERVVRPIAELADAGDGDFKAGEHCRFCRARKACRARADWELELAKHDFADPFLLTPAEIGNILGRVDGLIRWANDVKDYALQEVLNGGTIPGWKAVEGRSNRQYTNEAKAAEILLDAGYGADQVYKPQELLGITAMEKLLGKKGFTEHLTAVVTKPPGKPTLVPESDTRSEIDPAADFD